jgi:excinuclease ABC subunit B
MREAAANLEFETAARLRDEIKRLQATELVLADDPLATQSQVDEKTGGYRGPRKYGEAANLPASLPNTRARKPTLDEMGPHNLGGGTGRPLGATEAARSKAGRPGTRTFRGKKG